MGRINAWHMAFNLAKARFLGGGFDVFQPATFAAYAPDPDNVHDSHSIYFEVLGEHGFVGFALFLLLGLATWRTASWVIKHARLDPEKRWAADLAAMIQVSLVGYATAGAFLGLAYFDYYYTLVAVVVLCKTVLISQRETRQAEPGKNRRDRRPVARASATPPGTWWAWVRPRPTACECIPPRDEEQRFQFPVYRSAHRPLWGGEICASLSVKHSSQPSGYRVPCGSPKQFRVS